MNRFWSRALPLAATTAVGAAGAGFAFVRPQMLVWGATGLERNAPMDGDDAVPLAKYRSTHAISIAAPPEDVWPWLAQLGQGRGGLYSYDWLENLFGCDIHSVSAVVPQWQELQVGGEVRLVRPDHPVPLRFLVARVDPPHRLLLVAPGTQDEAFAAGLPYVSWSFQIDEYHRGYSRLVVRLRGDFLPTTRQLLANKYLLEPVHWLMERKMLLGIKKRAEQLAERRKSAGEDGAAGGQAAA